MFPLFFLAENLFSSFSSPLLCLYCSLTAAAEINSESGRGDYHAIADGGKDLILIFQCGSEEVGVSGFRSNTAIEILYKNRVNCVAREARKFIGFPLTHSEKARESSYLVFLVHLELLAAVRL